MRTKAPAKPTTGETAAGITTFVQRPCQTTPRVPNRTRAAPTSPPTSACVELEGKPRRQQVRFHATAPSSAASTVWPVARCVSTRPEPIVLATEVVTNPPARLAAAERATAGRGDRARVPTQVAT